MVHWERGDLDRAAVLLAEQVQICRGLAEPDRLARALARQSFLLRASGDDTAAEAGMQEALERAEEAGTSGLVASIEARSRANRALVLGARGDEAGAAAELTAALEVARSAGLSAVVEEIERCRDGAAGGPAGFEASLTRHEAKAHRRLAEMFADARARARQIRDDQESGLA